MTFSFARIRAIAAVAALVAASAGWAQTAARPASQAKTAASQPAPAKPQASQPSGKVIFSRSSDANGQTTTEAGPAAPQPAIQMASEPAVSDEARQAIRFTVMNLDVRLHPSNNQMAVRALLTVRNDGKTALTRVPLQISSTLNWEQIRVEGRDVSFPVATLNSDTDHTGQLHEAAVPLAQPLQPGATLQLDVTYSGTVSKAAKRLVAVGAPEDQALLSDWDEVTVPFTGLRGFGNVVWYPVASVPVILGDGARVFNEIGRHKQSMTGVRFRLRLTVEFPHGHPPTVALVNGHPVALKVTDLGGLDPEVTGVAAASYASVLGFEAPSIFAAIRKPNAGTNLTAWTVPEDDVTVESWVTEAVAVTPFVQGWLGKSPRAQLTLLDLPDPGDAPFEAGAMLAVPLRVQTQSHLDAMLVHAYAHAWMQSPRAWLSEGVAFFLDTLWMERQKGREQALGMLEADRAALALEEPSSPGESSGQPLPVATAPVYYRTKAAYVFWMLRDLAGDAAIQAALKAYDPAQDVAQDAAQDAASKGGSYLESLLKQGGARRDLSWFFADWVDADKGLPDLTIQSVFPNAAQAGTTLVAVNVSNSGYAAAEVPVSVRTAKATVTERLLVPARSTAVQRLLVMGVPTEAQVNDGTVPETEASVHVTKIDPPPPAPLGIGPVNPTRP